MLSSKPIFKNTKIYILSILACFFLVILAVPRPAQADTGRLAYYVRSGDTLASLSKRFYTESDLIAAMNGVDEAASLPVGKMIYLPKDPATNVTVTKGESLWAIAKKYHTTVDTLIGYNDLESPDQLKIGEVISIPNINSYEESDSIAVTKVSSRLGVLERATNKITTKANHKTTSDGVKWLCPLTGPITSDFGSRDSGFHHGVDVAAPLGAKVRSVAAGTVTFTGWKSWVYGNAVMIDHGNGWSSLYAHASKIFVKTGAWVKAGQTIMAVGQTGNATGPHLHIEVHQGGTILNPHQYIVFKSK